MPVKFNPNRTEKQREQNRRARKKYYYSRTPEQRAEMAKKRRIYAKLHPATKERMRKDVLAVHGLTPEIYNKMLNEQNNVCGICKREDNSNKSFFVDHCHSTGKIRGLLCHWCNMGLGHFKDNEENLLTAITYLKKYGNR